MTRASVIALCTLVIGCAPRSSRTQDPPAALPAMPALGGAIDRVGRPLTANAFIGPIDPGEQSSARKEVYNRAAPRDWTQFAPDIQRTLGLYDGYDGVCGNQWLAHGEPASRYAQLAAVLADDRVWIDTRATSCTQFFAVERAALSGDSRPPTDCGGRIPGDDAVDVIRSLLVDGTANRVTDGVDRDDHVHSTTVFPFLAAP